VTVQITEFKREGDSDIHLIMFVGGTYGIAEIMLRTSRSYTRSRRSRSYPAAALKSSSSTARKCAAREFGDG
jgi:hypothetical protein